MTKRNLIIVIILLSIMDMVAAGWYMSRRIESSGKSQSLFDQRDSTEVIAMADTVVSSTQADVFDKLQHNTYYFTANTPSITGDETSCCTSTKHVKVRWPMKVNGNDDLAELNKELIKKAFGNSQTSMKDARYVFLNTPSFNRPVGDDYRSLVKAPRVYPVYGNVTQVLVYPYMTSQRLLVMEIDKVEYDGSTTVKNSSYVHYDRMKQRILSRLDILVADVDKENQLLKAINKKIDTLNKGRGDKNLLQHALNVPADLCCGKKGILFEYKQGSISSEPVDILLEYGQLEPYMTSEFKQLQENNSDYFVYKNENIKPEPLNQATANAATAKAPAVKAKSYDDGSKKSYKSGYKKSYKKSYRGYKKSYRGYRNKYKGYKRSYSNSAVTPTRTKQRVYSGAKRRSGYRGHAAKRHWSRRQR